MLFNIIIGLILLIFGFLFVIKTKLVMSFTGRIGFAEKYFSSGGQLAGTWSFLKLIGVILIIFGLLYMTGLISNVFESTIGRFFGSLEQVEEQKQKEKELKNLPLEDLKKINR